MRSYDRELEKRKKSAAEKATKEGIRDEEEVA